MGKFFWLLSILLSCYSKNTSLEANALIAKKDILLSCTTETDCKIIGGRTNGTATRIEWDGNYYWLTAGHVCSSNFNNVVTIESQIVAIVAGSEEIERTEIVKIDAKKDLCLLKAKPNFAKKIARQEPKPGEAVTAVAYPGGVFDSSILPIYDGRWSGHLREENKCLITIPVAGGSSGAAVLNSDGEIVAVISSVLKEFNHLALASCHQDLLQFLESK